MLQISVHITPKIARCLQLQANVNIDDLLTPLRMFPVLAFSCQVKTLMELDDLCSPFLRQGEKFVLHVIADRWRNAKKESQE